MWSQDPLPEQVPSIDERVGAYNELKGIEIWCGLEP